MFRSLVICMLVLSLVLSGCAAPVQAKAPDGTPTPTPMPTPAEITEGEFASLFPMEALISITDRWHPVPARAPSEMEILQMYSEAMDELEAQGFVLAQDEKQVHSGLDLIFGGGSIAMMRLATWSADISVKVPAPPQIKGAVFIGTIVIGAVVYGVYAFAKHSKASHDPYSPTGSTYVRTIMANGPNGPFNKCYLVKMVTGVVRVVIMQQIGNTSGGRSLLAWYTQGGQTWGGVYPTRQWEALSRTASDIEKVTEFFCGNARPPATP